MWKLTLEKVKNEINDSWINLFVWNTFYHIDQILTFMENWVPLNKLYLASFIWSHLDLFRNQWFASDEMKSEYIQDVYTVIKMKSMWVPVNFSHKDLYYMIDVFRWDIIERNANATIKRVVKEGYIYCIESNWYYKIWRSKNFKKRFKKYITENPNHVEVIHSYFSDNCIDEEQRLHMMFEEKNHNREWFKLNQADIEYIKSL